MFCVSPSYLLFGDSLPLKRWWCPLIIRLYRGHALNNRSFRQFIFTTLGPCRSRSRACCVYLFRVLCAYFRNIIVRARRVALTKYTRDILCYYASSAFVVCIFRRRRRCHDNSSRHRAAVGRRIEILGHLKSKFVRHRISIVFFRLRNLFQ